MSEKEIQLENLVLLLTEPLLILRGDARRGPAVSTHRRTGRLCARYREFVCTNCRALRNEGGSLWLGWLLWHDEIMKRGEHGRQRLSDRENRNSDFHFHDAFLDYYLRMDINGVFIANRFTM